MPVGNGLSNIRILNRWGAFSFCFDMEELENMEKEVDPKMTRRDEAAFYDFDKISNLLYHFIKLITIPVIAILIKQRGMSNFQPKSMSWS